MHDVRCSNIYIQSHNICHILPLSIVIILPIKGPEFSKVTQTLSNIMTMRYEDIKDQIWIFSFVFYYYYYYYYFKLKKYYFNVEEMKRKAPKH